MWLARKRVRAARRWPCAAVLRLLPLRWRAAVPRVPSRRAQRWALAVASEVPGLPWARETRASPRRAPSPQAAGAPAARGGPVVWRRAEGAPLRLPRACIAGAFAPTRTTKGPEDARGARLECPHEATGCREATADAQPGRPPLPAEARGAPHENAVPPTECP